MTHPLWIINSTMLLFVVLAFLFARWPSTALPEQESITPKPYIRKIREQVPETASNKIFEEDLFGTYKKEIIQEKPIEKEFTIPEPPQPKPPVVPTTPEPQFLDPLDISLKGIIIIGYDPAKNSALILDNKTSTESVYKTGSTFEDAVLVKILANKVIFLRSNGQQEILYLRAEDAKKEVAATDVSVWNTIITSLGDNTYTLDPMRFVTQVPNLAQFIELLHLTTAYEKGVAIGCRIGSIENNSFGTKIGLAKNDIITSINGIAVGPLENRMDVYHKLVALPEESFITIELLRKGKPKTITIILRKQAETGQIETPSSTSLQKLTNDEKLNILKEKHQLAPTLQDIRKRERQHMLERSSAPRTRSQQ